MRSKIALIILILLILASVFAPLITKYNPVKIDLDSLKEPPGIRHFFGTDNKGRDIFSRVLYGGRYSMGIACVAGIFALAIGLTAGLVSGYYGREGCMCILMFVVL